MILYIIGRALTYPLVRCAFRVRYEGLEHIPVKGGYILACNHRSNFDPLAISHKVPQIIRYLAKAELCRIPVIGAIIRALAIIPIQRGTGDAGAISDAEQVIREGGVLGMFPEGHRSKDGAPLRPRSGMALIAGRTGADVLPCAVTYPKGVRFRAPLIIRYGPLIPGESLGINPDSPSTIRGASRRVMDEIIGLMGPPRGGV